MRTELDGCAMAPTKAPAALRAKYSVDDTARALRATRERPRSDGTARRARSAEALR